MSNPKTYSVHNYGGAGHDKKVSFGPPKPTIMQEMLFNSTPEAKLPPFHENFVMCALHQRVRAIGPLPGAIAAQGVGWLAALALAQLLTTPFSLPAVLGIQACAAVIVAWVLGCARWWLGIHAVFSPLVVTTRAIGLPPEMFLAAFCLLALVYWSSYRTQVPLYQSGTAAQAAVEHIFPHSSPAAVLDIGSGTGSFVIPRAARWPRSIVTGIESAPLPWLISRARAGSKNNIRLFRGDFYRHEWSPYDLVYAFLSPVPMSKVWDKAQREMKPSAILVSNTFAVPGITPDEIVCIEQAHKRTRFYIYRPAGQKQQLQK